MTVQYHNLNLLTHQRYQGRTHLSRNYDTQALSLSCHWFHTDRDLASLYSFDSCPALRHTLTSSISTTACAHRHKGSSDALPGAQLESTSPSARPSFPQRPWLAQASSGGMRACRRARRGQRRRSPSARIDRAEAAVGRHCSLRSTYCTRQTRHHINGPLEGGTHLAAPTATPARSINGRSVL